ncbi:aminotransferase class V-fold PLP-dependent enzyme [Variovorax sp. NFACC27]|uniref:aminotransferase class V-fold PLP-dependent enzyme n=1 Tax=unclassified Variovorax TaxID=663243 RepID=UPI000896F470|nr:selenocysteine lyase/cysteine desulfurase [Variovorax paradoxus]SEF21369.1 Selenocysteine lyase/Cysteine desulfurase [Variovorax sp. NFACC28]SEF44755.1 Selenocysteine lyase/Cysteine desulfurase [Variovorax sp. NFACC29]SFB66657.1 Selenocysteine lyase/Cysteine desulfurase [Variovorax sp. NFACC26]SFG47068.1 Selenocysteine lyase/Cysteine desulfurase [Variovorax sp. NFACC27]
MDSKLSSNHPRGLAFSDALMREVKARFLQVDHDHHGRERLYFDNAGGSFRLKAAAERFAQVDAIPDNAERIHATAVELQQIQAKGCADLRTILNATGGSVYASLTASGAMFDMVRAIAENVPGTNMVTTVLEHPSAFDAMSLYAQRLGRELRVAKSNPVTGGVDVDEIVRLVDKDTCLLNVIHASNISGAKLDMEAIVRRAREIKPDLYILVDAVQHAPHGLIDLQKAPVDGINLAPYKFFGCRGSGLSWVSERAAVLPHHKLAGKKPDYWDLGSSAPWQFAVLTEIVDYVCWLGGHFSDATDATDRRALFVAGITHIELHERALLSVLLDGNGNATGMRELEGVNVFLDYEDLSKRDLILGIGFDRIDCTQAVVEYAKRGVTVYERVASSIYSKRMLESFGLEGTVRVSPLHCNSVGDIEKFLRITREIAADI